MKRIAIIGSRNFKEKEAIARFMRTLKNVEIVSGGAAGVDSFAEEIAKELGLPVKIFRPRFYLGYDVNAYHKRNRKIAEYADEVHIFWHKPTPGSSSTMRHAALLKKPVFVHELRNAESLKEEEKKREEIMLFERAMQHVFNFNPGNSLEGEK